MDQFPRAQAPVGDNVLTAIRGAKDLEALGQETPRFIRGTHLFDYEKEAIKAALEEKLARLQADFDEERGRVRRHINDLLEKMPNQPPKQASVEAHAA
jgi:hypothetical protein